MGPGEISIAEQSVSYEPSDSEVGDVKQEELLEKKSEEPEKKPEEEKPKEEPEKKPEEEKTETKPEGEPDEKKPELPKGALKRINKLTARNYGLKKELAERDKKIAELEVTAGGKKIIEEIAEHNEKNPAKGDFESYEDYTDARTKWLAKSESLKLEKTKIEGKESGKSEREKQADADNQFNEVLEDVFKAGRDVHEDFEELVQDQNLKLTETMVLATLESDAGHEILYHLATNQEQSAKIAAMTPLQQAREIGKLETKIVKEEKKPDGEKNKGEQEEKVLDLSEQRKPPITEDETKNSTKAPAPIESVHGKSVTKKDPEKMSNEEYRNDRGYNKKGQKQ